MKSMKKQKGEFIISGMILVSIFLAIVTASEMTADEREVDLKAKQVVEATK